MDDSPITGLGIVADTNRCPAEYVVINKTFDTGEDADLWHDSKFAWNRVLRYICITRRQFDNSGNTSRVLIDLALLNDRDNLPADYTSEDTTLDTKEKSIKKKQLCVRYASRESTTTAITDVIVLGKSKRPPAGYTLIGELNSMQLCFKMGRVPQVTRSGGPITAPAASVISVPHMPSTAQQPLLQRAMSRHGNPLSGVPFEVNKKYAGQDGDASGSLIPNIPYKSLGQLESEFTYDFRLERTVLLC